MKRALIGFGGHSIEVMSQMNVKLPCFVDDGFETKGCLPLSKFNPDEYEIMIAISNSLVREKILKVLPKNTKFFTFIHPTSLIMSDVKIGYGCFIGAYSIVTTNITLGNHSILNRFVQIGHDSTVGDFFSGMPGSIVSGNCKIGDKVFLGNNSSINEKITVCDEVIIGSNGCVVKNINNSGTYVGVPVIKIK
jgi:sugar O-acyltransferase (sialic acid O-acetyltransferase NeuD family)